MRDSQALLSVPEVPAQIKESARGSLPSELDTVILVLGSWLQDHVVPLINQRLVVRRSTATSGERRRYYNTNKNELLAFFLQRFVKALIKHEKHELCLLDLATARDGLISAHRAKSLKASLDVGDHSLAFLYSTVPLLMAKFVDPGTTSAV